MKNNYYILALVLLLFSCESSSYNSEFDTIVLDSDFKHIDTFYFYKKIDIGIYTIEGIFCNKDNIIVSTNQKEHAFINIFSKDFSHNSAFGLTGHASNEFISPVITDITDTTISVYDHGKREIKSYGVDGKELLTIELKENIYQQCKLISSKDAILEYKTHDNISLCLNNERERVLYDFSIYKDIYPDPNTFFGFMEVSKGHNTIVYAHQYLKAITLLDLEGGVKCIIKREPSLPPVIGNKSLLDKVESVSYYWGIQKLPNSFIVCCLGYSGESLSKNLHQKVEFEEYSYDGKPIRKIIIDRFIDKFCFDGDTLYVSTIDDDIPLSVYKQSKRENPSK